MPQAADPTAAFTLSHTVGAFKFRRWDCTNSGQRKRSRAPVRSRHVPLSRPQPPQTAAKVRGFSPTAPGFTAETDSPVEGAGFEPSVPRNLCRRRSTGGGRPVSIGMTSADGDTRTVWAGDAAFSYLDDQHHVIHDRASAHPDSKIKANLW